MLGLGGQCCRKCSRGAALHPKPVVARTREWETCNVATMQYGHRAVRSPCNAAAMQYGHHAIVVTRQGRSPCSMATMQYGRHAIWPFCKDTRVGMCAYTCVRKYVCADMCTDARPVVCMENVYEHVHRPVHRHAYRHTRCVYRHAHA